MKTYIKGNYRQSIFSSEKGYVIGLFKVKETNSNAFEAGKTLTFTGYFHELNTEDTYIFYGEEKEHPRYGMQFNVDEYEIVKPTDKEGIITFLSSDLFPGVGEMLAKKIVDVIGENAIQDILNDKSCLYLVPKLSQKKADKIYEILKQHEESSSTIVYLTDIGFSLKEALLIYNEYKSVTLNVIDLNIYKITFDISEISFSKVDNIAKNIGILKDDKRRIKAHILNIINILVFKTGDTYVKKDTIINNIGNLLGFALDNYDDYFKELEEEGKIIKYEDNYYLYDMWKAEENIVERLYALASKKTITNKKIDNLINIMESSDSINYNDKQRRAIKKALENNIIIITGGPGTGKTTIIKAITEIYKKLNNLSFEQMINSVALLAPTGRASKRMSESTGYSASTIHRFLKWDKDSDSFMVNENNPSRVKLVIVDEVSMIDLVLFDNLLKGLMRNVKLVLVGDHNQLPSVGPGTVLKDLIKSDTIETIYLDLLYRQSEDSYILKLAEEVKNNELSSNFLEPKNDYMFLKCSSSSIRANLSKICMQIVNKGYDYKRLQLLAPMYKGENGIDILNMDLQKIFNPPSRDKNEIKYGNIIYRENDKVLQLVNMPDDNVFNGDVGIIKYIKNDKNKIELYIDFDGNTIKYTPKDFNSIKHAFIISIHKSQGSEFEMIIMPICNSYKRMLYRKLIYTGVTRAKNKLILIGEPEAFALSVQNNNEHQRQSLLLEKLKIKFHV